MSIICFGELIIDFLPAETGEKLKNVSTFVKTPGGAPANVAVGINYHGIPVSLWSKVGHDSFGDFLISNLQRRGVDTNGITRDKQHPTKLAFIEIGVRGERSFEFHNLDSAEKYIQPDEIDEDKLRAAKLFHFGGVALLGKVTANTTLHLLEIARESGCIITFDPNIRLDLCADSDLIKSRIDEIITKVDILKLNKDEYDILFEGFEVKTLLSRGISLLIITLGTEGCRIITQEFDELIPALPVEAVDTTGAGDAFMAAMLVQVYNKNFVELNRLSEFEIKRIGNFANQWGGLAISFPGATAVYEKK